MKLELKNLKLSTAKIAKSQSIQGNLHDISSTSAGKI